MRRASSIFAFLHPLRVTDVTARERAGNINASAIRLLNAAGSISGSRIAGIIHGTLASEAQEISTISMQYIDPEYPTARLHPIIYGFSLPPAYFSRTPSTDIVVKVFCQMVSYVCDQQAWNEYSIPSDCNILARVRDFLLFLPNLNTRQFYDLERSWTGDKARDQALFSSLGPSRCANLIKVGYQCTTNIKFNIIIGTAGVIP